MRSFIIMALAAVTGLCSAAPIIGLNTDVSGHSADNPRLALSSTYVDAITSAGGIPVLLPPVLDAQAVARYVQMCDGFVFTGGSDISPERYGEVATTQTKLINPRRESYDFQLLQAVLKSGKPVLGVCLGSQELNVAVGGSMIQDISAETSSTIDHRNYSSTYAHTIAITTGTRLNDITGTTSLQVNSMHHQACGRLGTGVVVMARAPDGIVESFDVTGKPFAIGVQWHPEKLTTAPAHLAVYQALIQAADK